ncbi:ParA family protein [Sphingomonas dokdonensis]|uniref:Sporulation initiation inhibitor protein Soj n=1 Tax=Sphingomonas dokdonensis TaxID=344880 RepID=A0A245ZGC8_9SPHN|nr:ParA family protein [Sphingomonas dokdonensis]OWK28786.1 sporulation initiation inhibitor protein Soj [Sphingomonas dokdonensis]
MAKRVSVINFKGGVGKTTFSFELAAGLARYHKPARVLAVDMDHQSSLSILCLKANGWDRVVQTRNVVDKVFRSFVSEGATLPGREIIYQASLAGSHYQNLHVVPASLQLDDIEIELTATHRGNAIQSEWNKRTLMCRWLEENRIDEDYDYIIFDCPPATKIVSQNAIAASHGYIIPVVPEAVMERGAPHLAQMVRTGIDAKMNAIASFGDARSMFVAETKLAGVVVTRIQSSGGFSGYTDDHTQHLNSLQRRWGADLLEPYIPNGTGVSQTLSAGVPVYDWAGTQNIGNRGIHTAYRDLTEAVKARIDAL